MKSQNVVKDLKQQANSEKAIFLSRFFKTGPGEYGYGDKFLGIVVPETRKIAKRYQALELKEISKLLESNYHEVRLCGLIILTNQFKKSKNIKQQKIIYNFYLSQARKGRINNWDLVDVTAPTLGSYLFNDPNYLEILIKLAKNRSLWLRRISILFTFAFIKKGETQPTLIVAKDLLADREDLMHKATGWALREVGKHKKSQLIGFLKQNVSNMNRTTLRYAIEKFPEKERRYWLNK
ncbi:MAG: DNA alkylation repair protein [Candidatus Nanopelagicales bacterium]